MSAEGQRHPAMRVAFAVLQLVDGFATTRDHAAGRLTGFGSLELRAHAIL